MKFLFVACLLSTSLFASHSRLCFKTDNGKKDFYMDISQTDFDNYQLIIMDSHEKIRHSENVKLLSRAKCIDCNEDVFESSRELGSRIRFDGKRSDAMNPFSETGIVYLGATRVSYIKTNCPKSVLSSGDV